MRYKTLLLAIAFVASIITGTFAETGKKQTPPKAPEHWVLVEEVDLLVFENEPATQFHKARESFFKKDMKASAAEIRKGATFLKMQEGRATAEGKKALMASVNELEKLAKGVENGTIKSVKELDQTFARAHHALALHHQLKAKESWVKKEAKMAGHDLKAAAIHLEHALKWSGHELKAGVVNVIKDTGLLAGKLIEGIGWVPEEVGSALEYKGKGGVLEEVGKAIEYIGNEIEKLGKMLEPTKE